MKIRHATLKFDGDPVSKTRGVIPCGQHDGVLKTLKKMMKTVKCAVASASPKMFQELDTFLDKFLLQYGNAIHAITRGSPARGIITRKIGTSMMEITDPNDTSVHRRHIDQNHFREPTIADEHPSTSETTDRSTEPQQHDAHGTQQSADVAQALPEDDGPLTSRRPVRRASQIDEALLREESCGEPSTRGDPVLVNTRYGSQTNAVAGSQTNAVAGSQTVKFPSDTDCGRPTTNYRHGNKRDQRHAGKPLPRLIRLDNTATSDPIYSL